MKRYTSQEIKEFVSKLLFDEKVLLNKDLAWPKISIVTPSYNQVEFLERTILSVLNQNYPNLEYIIIDGGSSDGSVEIIKKYEKYLAYWTSESDKGQADALRKGFDISTGEIMGWLNSDDILLLGTFLKIVNLFISRSEIDVIYGSINLIDEEDNILARRDHSGRNFSFNVMLFESNFPQPATFWRRGIYTKSGRVDPSFQFCMDLDLWVKFWLAGGKFLRVNDVLANFRSHPSSKSLTMDEVRKKERQLIVERVLGRKVGFLEMKYRYLVNKMKRYFSNPLDLIRGINFRFGKKIEKLYKRTARGKK